MATPSLSEFDPATIGATPVSAASSGGDFDPASIGATPVGSSQGGHGFLQTAEDVGGAALNFVNNNPVSRGITSLSALPVQMLAKAMGQPDPYAGGIGTGPGTVHVTSSDQPMGKYAEEELGNAATVGSLFIPAGRIAAGAETGLKSFLPTALSKAAPAVSRIAAGGVTGYATDVGNNMQQKSDQPFSPGFGTFLGSALPMAGPLLKGVGKAAALSTGVSTGAGNEAIEEGFTAAKNGGAQGRAYLKTLWGQSSPEEIVNEAKGDLGKILSERSNNYKGFLDTMHMQTKSLDISPVLENMDKQLGKFGVTVGEDGALDFSRSAIGDGADQSSVQKIFDDVRSWGSKAGDRTPSGIDILKRRIGNYYSPNSDVRALVTAMKNATKGVLEQAPGYTDAMKNYSNMSDTIEDITKALSLGDKASVDTAFRKLTTALRTNNEFRQEMLQQLNVQGKGTLIPKIAGQQLSEVLPRGLARQIEGFGAGAAVLSGSLALPTIAKLALVASPRLVGTFAAALGSGVGQFQKLLPPEVWQQVVPHLSKLRSFVPQPASQ